MFHYFKIACSSPLNILEGRKMTFNTFFQYLIALVFITLIPVLITIPRLFGNFQADIHEVSQKIPPFEVQDGKIETSHEEYLHFTDTVALYFDPEDELTQENVIQRNVDLGFAPLNIALSEKQLSFYIGDIQQAIPYSSLPGFDYNLFLNLLSSMSQANWLVILVGISTLFFIGSLILFYQLFVVTLTNYFIALFSAVRLKLSTCFKVTILSTTLPIIALTLSRILGMTSIYNLPLFTIFSCSIFFLALRNYKNQLKENT